MLDSQILLHVRILHGIQLTISMYFFLSHSYFVLRMYRFLVLGAFMVASGYWPPQFKYDPLIP